MEYFVTFWAVRYDKSKTPEDVTTRLASKLIYRSNCSINGNIGAGYTYGDRLSIGESQRSLKVTLKVPLEHVIEEVISDSVDNSARSLLPIDQEEAQERRGPS